MLVRYYTTDCLNLPDVIGINGKMLNCKQPDKLVPNGMIAYYEGGINGDSILITVHQDGDDFEVTSMLNNESVYNGTTCECCDCCDDDDDYCDDCESKDILEILGEACTAIEDKTRPSKSQSDINVNVNITTSKDKESKKKKLQHLLEQLLSEED